MKKWTTRRDMCDFIGRRAAHLTPMEAAAAWAILARRLQDMGEMDVPKFMDLLVAIRASYLTVRKLRAAAYPDDWSI